MRMHGVSGTKWTNYGQTLSCAWSNHLADGSVSPLNSSGIGSLIMIPQVMNFLFHNHRELSSSMTNKPKDICLAAVQWPHHGPLRFQPTSVPSSNRLGMVSPQDRSYYDPVQPYPTRYLWSVHPGPAGLGRYYFRACAFALQFIYLAQLSTDKTGMHQC
jgi:hypothetical protein